MEILNIGLGVIMIGFGIGTVAILISLAYYIYKIAKEEE